MEFIRSGALALSIAAGMACLSAGSATALPIGLVADNSMTAQLDQAVPTIQARYYRGYGGYYGGYHGGNAGAGVAAGIVGGLLLGGIIASQQPYYYGAAPYYGAPVYAPAPYASGDAVGYCMRRYKSFDPGSMTYLGYDGLRHSCP